MIKFIKTSVFIGILLFGRLNFLLYAFTEVAGLQSGIWSLERNPYIVKGNIIVPKGLVLKIEEGVVVKFAGKYHLRVEGGLIAKGNKANPIVFTSIYDNEFGKLRLDKIKIPQLSEWEGIEFLDCCDDYLSVLNYCIIRYSKWGVQCSNSYPLLINILFVDNEISSLKINNQEYLFESGLRVSPISDLNRPALDPLPEPFQETDLEKAIRMMKLQQQRIEQQRLKAIQDSLQKAQKAKPIFSKTGTIFLDREILDQLHFQSIDELISYFPGFLNIATIWNGFQITSRGLPPILANNRLLFLINGLPFYEPITKMSYLDFTSLEAIERIVVKRGGSLSPFNHHSIIGSINFIPRYSSSGLMSKSKIELGAFGTKKLTTFLGLNRDSTFLSLSSKFVNNAGYWRTISQDESGVSFRQKYANDIYNFSAFFKHPSLTAFTSYFEHDQQQLGLVPQGQYGGPIYRRGLVFSLTKEVVINPRLMIKAIGSYVDNYERLDVGSLGTEDPRELSTNNYSVSKGNILTISVISRYRMSSYLASAGLAVSRLLVQPLFEIKSKIDTLIQFPNWGTTSKISEYETSGFIKIGSNVSPFVGIEGTTFINFTNSMNRPDLSVDAKIIYNPFWSFESYLKYSRMMRSATIIERRINLPNLFIGTSQLKPEKFDQWEWTTDIHPLKNWTLGFMIYYLESNNLIKLNSLYQFTNMEKTYWTTGYELLVQGKINHRLFLVTNISYYNAKSSGWNLPKFTINGLVTFRWHQNFSTVVAFQHLSQIKTSLNMGPYYLAHLTLAYHLLPKIKISVNGFDLLNQRPVNPEYIRGIIPAIPAGSGRSFYITMSIE